MIRCKITPRITDAGVHVDVEWVEVAEGERIARTVEREEFAIGPDRQGSAYITRGGFDEGTFLPGTFFIDEAGRRHFVMDAEAGVIGIFGQKSIQEVR